MEDGRKKLGWKTRYVAWRKHYASLRGTKPGDHRNWPAGRQCERQPARWWRSQAGGATTHASLMTERNHQGVDGRDSRGPGLGEETASVRVGEHSRGGKHRRDRRKRCSQRWRGRGSSGWCGGSRHRIHGEKNDVREKN